MTSHDTLLTEPQRKHGIRIDHSFHGLLRLCRQALRLRRKLPELRTRLADLKTMHPEFHTPHARKTSGYLFLLGGLLCVFVIDVLMFGATAEYIAMMVFYDAPFMVKVVQAVLPVVIIGLEVNIAIQIYFARDEADEEGRRSGLRTWIGIGLSFSLMMPALVIATQLAAIPPGLSGRLQTIFLTQLVGLALLAFVPHVVILFGGRHAHNAKAYYSFGLQRGTLRRRLRTLREQVEETTDKAVERYGKYRQVVESYNRAYPDDARDLGPFPSDVAALLHQHIGLRHPLSMKGSLVLEEAEDTALASQEEAWSLGLEVPVNGAP